MFLTEKQNQALDVPFGYRLDALPFATRLTSGGSAYVLAESEAAARKLARCELTVRQVLDLGLDGDLLMSKVGTHELAVRLNQKLPPVWPGESPIDLALESRESPDWFLVTVPSKFHHRLHRFPFEDGFFVCPVPHCTGSPRFLGTIHGVRSAGGSRYFIFDNSCDAGHRWQCVFCEGDQVTSVSIVRMKQKPEKTQ
jgi:hypothetical protein